MRTKGRPVVGHWHSPGKYSDLRIPIHSMWNLDPQTMYSILSAIGLKWCSCPDNSTNRGIMCKHQSAIEYAIRLGTLKDIEKLPEEAKRYNSGSSSITAAIVVQQQQSESYIDDDYSF